jgi:hypothetical protein
MQGHTKPLEEQTETYADDDAAGDQAQKWKQALG